MEHLRADDARRLFLWAQGLLGVRDRPRTPGEALQRMGVVQLDTISVLARSHELVQYARLGPIGRPAVEAAYWRRPPVAFEYWAHAACIIPLDDWPWHEPRRRGRWAKTIEAARRHPEQRAVLDRLADGPATATELGGAKKGGIWWDWSEAKLAAESLLMAGLVVCVERRGWKRVYDLAERVIPPELLDLRPSAHQCRVELVRRAAQHLGVATRRDLADYYRLLLGAVDAVLPEVGLEPVTVEGWDEPAWADLEALRSGRVKGRHRTTLLSPFDPVVWDRARTERLFGFNHRLEAYTPKPKRVFGYFAMPVLSGGRLVGRVDPARSGRTFVANVASIERGGAASVPAVAAAVVEAASWVGAEAIAVDRVEPPELAAPLRAAVASAAG